MRDIKFRAWDNHEQVWMRRNDALFLSANTKGIYNLRKMDGKTIVVMQYTGLKDKNGVEIYERDIIVHAPEYMSWPITLQIIWDALEARYISIDAEGNVYPYAHAVAKDNEVIGNIYENGDLLK